MEYRLQGWKAAFSRYALPMNAEKFWFIISYSLLEQFRFQNIPKKLKQNFYFQIFFFSSWNQRIPYRMLVLIRNSFQSTTCGYKFDTQQQEKFSRSRITNHTELVIFSLFIFSTWKKPSHFISFIFEKMRIKVGQELRFQKIKIYRKKSRSCFQYFLRYVVDTIRKDSWKLV